MNGSEPVAKWVSSNWLKPVWYLFRCVFGLVVDEIAVATKAIKPTLDFIKLQDGKEYPEYADLTIEGKKVVEKFVKVREECDNAALRMIHLESAVQLVFYLTLLLFQVHEVPLLELNYNESTLNVATGKWILGLLWLLLKTMLSGYSTFSPIFRALRKDSYKLSGSAPSISQFICVTFNLLLDLMTSACITFLAWFFIQME